MTVPHCLRHLGCGLAAIALSAGGPAIAQTAKIVELPAAAGAPEIRLAAQYDLDLQLPEGRGLARLLIDAGIAQTDAAAAARLAAGHLGDGTGGCVAKISVVRGSASRGFSLVRVMLTTQTDRTVIERRGDDLTIASQAPLRQTLRLV